ncbi:MAG: ribosome biogenesis GTPase YqeH [Sporolactobacillus sp.]|jgi:ribosome biogenesis GTPase YqeH|nr:ribosome biogenesis GTPase YqeH [Sporolactobacillus sp.]
MEQLYCSGCGVSIQTVDEQAPGYTPPAALGRDPVLCRRCYRLIHYNEVQDVPLGGDDFRRMLEPLARKKALIVYMIDIFDVAGSWIDGFQELAGRNPLLLIGNKQDLLPKSTNPNKLKNWLRRSAKSFGLKPVDVLLISAAKNDGLDEAMQAMAHWRRGRDVYIVGATNVGKSTFVNHLIRASGGEAVLTTSRFPGTTLGLIGIPLDEGGTLYDTPGVVNPDQAVHFVGQKDSALLMPKKEVKSRVYQLNEGQTLFLGGLGRVDYREPGRRSLIVYASNRLVVHRTRTDRAAELYRRQYGRLLTPPSVPGDFPELKPYHFRTDEENSDIVFSGLGWVMVKGSGAVITAWAPEPIGVSMRPSIIKG